MTKRVLLKPDGHCNPSGLELIEEMASKNRTQGSIAAAFGIPKKKFEQMLSRQKGDNPERLAWERGRAIPEQRLLDVMMASAVGDLVDEEEMDEKTGEPTGRMIKVRVQSKTGGIHAIYLTKSQFGWDEKGSQQTTNNDNRIQINLAEPTTKEEMFKRLGIKGPLDFRKDKSLPPPAGIVLDDTPPMKLLNPPAPAEPETPPAAPVPWFKKDPA